MHVGAAFVGNVGGRGVTDFTALGDTVNATARLQSEAQAGEIVMSDAIYQWVSERHPDLASRRITLRGRAEPMTVRVLTVSL